MQKLNERLFYLKNWQSVGMTLHCTALHCTALRCIYYSTIPRSVLLGIDTANWFLGYVHTYVGTPSPTKYVGKSSFCTVRFRQKPINDKSGHEC